MAMLGSTLLVYELCNLVDRLLLLAELHVGPQVEIARDDVDQGILGLRTPKQGVEVVAAEIVELN